MTQDSATTATNSFSTPDSGTITKNSDGSITVSGFANPNLDGTFSK
ncbi:hypothetical protein [Fructilactobacillus frigidiflavus]